MLGCVYDDLLPRALALESGLSIDAIKHRLRVGRWEAPTRGVYWTRPDAVASLADQVVRRAIASTMTCERATISHAAAGLIFGLPTLRIPHRACLSVPAGTALRALADVHLHRATLVPEDLHPGFRITSVARTVLDIAREDGVESGLVLADAALRANMLEHAQLLAALERCAGWPGRRSAARVAALCDGRAESVLETLSRLRFHDRGLPAPELQVEIADHHGQFVARVDFLWPEHGVVGEADGNLKYDAGREAIVAERRRQQQLEDLGLIVVRWEWGDLTRFEVVERRLREAFARTGRPDPSWLLRRR
jgi:hypothetical protein